MSERKASLSGIIPPLPTPFTKEGDIDAASFRKLADHLITGRVGAVFVAGTAGLGPQMTSHQYGHVLELALECFDNKLPVLAGVIECSTPRAIERIRLLESLGYKQFVLTSTYYLPPANQEQLLVHFGRCAESTEMEMIVYNIPSCTGINIETATVEEMVKRKWTRTVKDSSGNARHFSSLCELGGEMGLDVFQGLRPDIWELAQMGASGCVPVPGNIRPDIFSEAWQAAKKSDRDKTAKLQEKIDLLWHATVSKGDFLSGTLYALSMLGIMNERLIEPLAVATREKRAAVDSALLKIGC